jgi:hypothetical protein
LRKKKELLRQTQLPLKSCERKQKGNKKTTKNCDRVFSQRPRFSTRCRRQCNEQRTRRRRRRRRRRSRGTATKAREDEREGRRRAPFITAFWAPSGRRSTMRPPDVSRNPWAGELTVAGCPGRCGR